METEANAVTKARDSVGAWRTIARAFLVILALFLLWAGDRAFFHMEVQRAAQLTVPSWGGWLWSVALIVLAGVAFGFAAMLPERARYRPTRGLLLGIVPLLTLMHAALDVGPGLPFALRHLRFLVYGRQFFFDVGGVGLYAVPVLLGVAIAAGFAPGE